MRRYKGSKLGEVGDKSYGVDILDFLFLSDRGSF